MNIFVGTGNLTKNIEVRYTTNNNAVGEFSIAINNGKDKEPDFINCVVWNKQAENMAKYTQKGDMVSVEGSLKTDTYEKDGQKRYRTYVLANRVQFLKTKGNPKDTTQEMGNDLPIPEVPW